MQHELISILDLDDAGSALMILLVWRGSPIISGHESSNIVPFAKYVGPTAWISCSSVWELYRMVLCRQSFNFALSITPRMSPEYKISIHSQSRNDLNAIFIDRFSWHSCKINQSLSPMKEYTWLIQQEWFSKLMQSLVALLCPRSGWMKKFMTLAQC